MTQIPFQPYLLGVIGWPLGHSLSPLLHNWALGATGLGGGYHAWPIQPDRLGAFMLSMRLLRIWGCSVTIPFKQRVIPFLDGLTDQARRTGAVNTIFWRSGGLWGENTDCDGFLNPLRGSGQVPGSALILGAGGAALACIAALRGAGVGRIAVAARKKEALASLQQHFDVQGVSWEERSGHKAELLVNTTPLGMSGHSLDSSPMPGEALTGFDLVYDLIYNPSQTRLLRDAKAMGRQTLGGLAMFVHQGAAQFELWTGHSFDVPRAVEVLSEHLGSSGSETDQST
jgi:shikimate dehydrogenase